MKYDEKIFKKLLNCKNAEKVFDYLLDNLKETVKSWDYFVNWDKVQKNYNDIKLYLHMLDTLVGSKNVEHDAEMLLQKEPEIIKIIPALLAMRDKKISILVDRKKFKVQKFDFSEKTPVKDGVKFMKESGFLKLVSDRNIKSMPDYFIGVETGLDSNGRKNRSGKSMENLMELFIKDICDKNGWEYIAQATAEKIKKQWGKYITVKKSSKRIDFAVNTPHKLFLIETNFYDDGGSKLKSTAGEYADIYKQWTKDGHQFIWITDGLGWKKTRRPLRDAFDKTDYILNISMVQKGVLEALLKHKKTASRKK